MLRLSHQRCNPIAAGPFWVFAQFEYKIFPYSRNTTPGA